MAKQQLERRRTNRIAAIFAVFFGFVLIAPSVAFAIAKGYSTDESNLLPGLFVSITDNSSAADPKVELSTPNNSGRAIGVVTTSDESLLSVSSGTKKVLVETDGQAQVYVSDLGGQIKKGDLLAVSALKGVLVKGDYTNTAGVAIALDDVNFLNNSQKTTVSDNGSPRQANVVKVNANLDPKAVSTKKNELTNQTNSPLAKLGRAIVGREVSELRVIVALIIFLLVLIVEGAILYGATSTAIMSLGRNPLARRQIVRELMRVAVLAVIVLSVGIGAIYAVLKL